MTNPYFKFVSEFADLIVKAKTLPLGGIAPQAVTKPAANAPVALVFSPHPDDECLIGGFALRLMREAKMRIINIAVTHGSNPARQPGRWQELSNACHWIGFDLEATAPDGLEKINVKTRTQSPEHWKSCVQAIASKFAQHKPRVIFVPHELDSNSTHIGTHFLVMDALQSMPSDFECFIVETEFWGQMASPNLMVEMSSHDLADLLAALSFHVEEMKRNPYHLGLPAWMRDNVRRGAELVGAQGGAAPDYMFAILYRLRRWKNGRIEDVYQGGKQISLKDSPGELFNSPCSQTP